MIVNAIDHGMDAQPAVDAPRLHFEDGLVYAEPGIEDIAGRTMVRFRERNLFFGGCQAAERHHGTGAFSGGGDPRRGGAVVAVYRGSPSISGYAGCATSVGPTMLGEPADGDHLRHERACREHISR